jgi:NAD(P)-dependent dehydrogenase (short-subunit alcohol dehydrogenase family)
MASGALDDRVVAVTGAARGIGRAIAEELAHRGARVALGDVDAGAAEAAASELAGDAMGVQLDVTDAGSFAAFLDAAEERLGALDVLVNNAGVMIVGPFAEQDAATAERVLAVNLHGVVTGMRLALPRLRAGGQIVNVVSASAFVAPPALSTYAASKHAVKALTDSVRAEQAPRGITVTAVYPNVVSTPLAAGTRPARGGKWIEPAEVADAVADGVERPRGEIFIPRSLGAALRIQSALPPRAKALLWRALGLHTLYTTADLEARREYEGKVGTTQS